MADAARVLIVDDEDLVVGAIRAALADEGYEFSRAADGLQALALVAERIPDLIILDVLIPGITGYEVCSILKNDPIGRFIPIMLVTGLSSTDEMVHGFDRGADDFIGKPFNAHELRARVRSLLRFKNLTDRLEHVSAVIETLANAVEARDRYTVGHARRVANLSVELARACGASDTELDDIRSAGILHDVGKIGTPETVLNKPGALTASERRQIEAHPVLGGRICRPLRTSSNFRSIIRHHHERLDGSGYPDGLKGDEIHMAARTVALCDIFDALTTDRPYRKGLPQEVGLQIIRDEVKRGYWDRQLFEVFVDMVGDGWHYEGTEFGMECEPATPLSVGAIASPAPVAAS